MYANDLSCRRAFKASQALPASHGGLCFPTSITDASAIRQFLVAEEVGLGKTIVARGVIAKAIEELTGKVDRIDVICICSNQAIAEQNIKSLNVM
ncbi:hypothetical protein [Mesorhizobium sp. M0244]|uniref:hypothetical protein n=1 Tax=Mesorhizobium sp. M0244 TaxID=2956926 RepID=UPI00333502F8